MESTEQEKDKQNPAAAEGQDNMAATSEFRFFSALNFSLTKLNWVFCSFSLHPKDRHIGSA